MCAALSFFLLAFGVWKYSLWKNSVMETAGQGKINVLAHTDKEKNSDIEILAGELHAGAAVLMDADSGRILYGKEENAVLPMASTTKIMTCIIALEYGRMEDIVSVSSYAAAQPKVHLGMKPGQQFRVEDLLYSMMLESHNDSAVAIAEYVGNALSEKEAVEPKESGAWKTEWEKSQALVWRCMELMNAKAREIGCPMTFFVTPNGLDATAKTDQGEKIHATTAKELAKIMQYCLYQSTQREAFRSITGMPEYRFTDVDGKRSYACRNHNALLTMQEGAISGKTGFTGKAGYCYVGAVEKEGKHLIVALLACGWPNHKTWKWQDTAKLLKYGLTQYTYKSLAELSLPEGWDNPLLVKGLWDIVPVSVKREEIAGAMEGLLVRTDETLMVRCRREKTWQTPIKKGEVIGEICYLLDGKVMRKDRILAEGTVEEVDLWWCIRAVKDHFLL